LEKLSEVESMCPMDTSKSSTTTRNSDPKEWAWKAQNSRSTVGFIMQSTATKSCAGEEEDE
jgi:hypothetical protein